MRGARLSAAAAAFAFVVPAPSTAQSVRDCEGKTFLECMALITDEFAPWQEEHIAEYANAIALAKWNDSKRGCDTLHHTALQIFPASVPLRNLSPVKPLGLPPVWFVWARFKQSAAMDTLDGFTWRGDDVSPTSQGEIFVVIRTNWLRPTTETQHKHRLFTTVLHELAHVAGKEEEEADRLEECAKRDLTSEEGRPKTASWYQTSAESLTCRYEPRWECRRFTLLEAPPWAQDDSDDDSDGDSDSSGWCGSVVLSYGSMTLQPLWLCTGVPATMCWAILEPLCSRTGAAAPGRGRWDGVLAEGDCPAPGDLSRDAGPKGTLRSPGAWMAAASASLTRRSPVT